MAKKDKKKKGGSGVVSINPDTFASTSLADNVTGVIRKARVEPFDYRGRAAEYGWCLSVRVEVEPDENSEWTDYVIEGYKATSNLDDFLPGDEDGNPVDVDAWEPEGDGSSLEGYSNIEDVQGVTFVRVGKNESKVLGKGTNFAFFLNKLIDAGFLKYREFTGNVAEALEGLHVSMVRIDPPERKGLEANKNKQILVVERILGVEGEKSSKKSKKSRDEDEEEEEEIRVVKKKAKASAAAEEAEEDEDEDEDEEEEATTTKKKGGGGGDLEDRVVEAVEEVLEGKTMMRPKVATKIVKMFKSGEKTKVMAILGNDDWVADDDRPWEYDEDDDTMSMEEDEE